MFGENQAYYESKAYRILDRCPEECGQDSVVLSCERCEEARMGAVRLLHLARRMIRKSHFLRIATFSPLLESFRKEITPSHHAGAR
jgi:hypothetical protein